MSPAPVSPGQLRKAPPGTRRRFVRVGAQDSRRHYALEAWEFGAWVRVKPRSARGIAERWPEPATEEELDARKCAGPGPCGRLAVAHGLCPGHLAQQRRGTSPLRPLRGEHGAMERATVPVRFDAHADTVQLLTEEADRRGVPASDVYREALDAYAKNLPRDD